MVNMARISTALAGLLLTTGCTNLGLLQTPPETRQTLQGVQKIGRCHMGGCTWFRIDDFAMIRETPDDAFLRVNVRWGSSSHPDGRMPNDRSRNVPIAWRPEIEEVYLYCTSRLPALIEREEDGSWQAARMDLVGTAGAMESSASLYAAVCHPGEDWRGEGFAARHGYRSVDGDFFIPLRRPDDILRQGR
jgi:hypothetical protein